MNAFPQWAVREDKSAAAIVSVWVDPSGRIYDCKALQRIGDKRLADEICSLVLRRRIPGAVDHEGAAVTGNIVTLIKLTLPGTPVGDQIARMTQPPDLTLELNRLPQGLSSPYKLGLAVEVGVDGSTGACNGTLQANETLAHIACERLAAETFEVALNKDGAPVPYVRSLTAMILVDGH